MFKVNKDVTLKEGVIFFNVYLKVFWKIQWKSLTEHLAESQGNVNLSYLC